MRSVLTLSVPAERKEEIVTRARKAKKTVSAYVIQALDVINGMISEDELLSMSLAAEKNYKKGKTKVLKSLKDLME